MSFVPQDALQVLRDVRREFRRHTRFICTVLQHMAARGEAYSFAQDLLLRFQFNGYFGAE